MPRKTRRALGGDETTGRPPAATRIPPPAPPGTEAGRRRRSGLAGIWTPTFALQERRAARLHHEPMSTSGAGVEPARAEALPPSERVRCRSASRTKKRSRCPPYASFCSGGIVLSVGSPTCSRGDSPLHPIRQERPDDVDHPPWRRSRFVCGRPASRPPGLRRTAFAFWSEDVPQRPLWPPSAAHGLLDIYPDARIRMRAVGVEPTQGLRPSRPKRGAVVRLATHARCARSDSNRGSPVYQTGALAGS